MTVPEILTHDPDGFIHVTDHRIGLQDIVYFYNEGYSPEMLLEAFPTLELAQIEKVIAYYLANQAEVDAYIEQCETEMQQQRAAARKGPNPAELRRRLEDQDLLGSRGVLL